MDNSVTNILLMNKENCAIKLVDEISLRPRLPTNFTFLPFFSSMTVCFKTINMGAEGERRIVNSFAHYKIIVIFLYSEN